MLGKRVKPATSDLAFGKEDTLRTFGKDKYERTLADVLLPDGLNVNHVLVTEGWCWKRKPERRRKECGPIPRFPTD